MRSFRVYIACVVWVLLHQLALAGHIPERNGIDTKDNAANTIERKNYAEQQPAKTIGPTAVVPQIHTNGADGKGNGQANDAGDQTDEFWTLVHGYRIKISDAGLILFTALLSLATLALWWSTRRLVKGAEETSRRQLRAYITTVGCSITFERENPSILLNYKNSGQTPASDVCISYVVNIFDVTKDEIPEYVMAPARRGILGINQQHTEHIICTLPLSAEDLMDLKAPEHLGIRGKITYRSIFNMRRETNFSYYVALYSSDKELAISEFGNTMD